jgi:hypothetical protein
MSVRTITCGKRYGKWEVIDPFAAKSKSGNRLVLCRCNCGTEKIVWGSALLEGTSKGCSLCREGFTDPMSRKVRDRWIHIWRGMLNRVLKKTDEAYPSYGGRGIRVCKSWRLSRRRFLEWVLTQPGYDDPKMTLDRKDNDGHYCPKNCRLVSRLVQNRNKRSNRIVCYKNRKMSVAEFHSTYASTFDYGTIRLWVVQGVPLSEIDYRGRRLI